MSEPKLPSIPDLDEHMKECIVFSEGMIDKETKSVPVFISVKHYDSDEKVLKTDMISVLGGLPEDKHGFMQSLGMQFIENDKMPMSIVLCTEAWSAPQNGDMMPRDNPDRIEIAMICGLTADRKSSMWRFEIKREGEFIIPAKYEQDVDMKEIIPAILTAFFRGVLLGVAKYKPQLVESMPPEIASALKAKLAQKEAK